MDELFCRRQKNNLLSTIKKELGNYNDYFDIWLEATEADEHYMIFEVQLEHKYYKNLREYNMDARIDNDGFCEINIRDPFEPPGGYEWEELTGRNLFAYIWLLVVQRIQNGQSN